LFFNRYRTRFEFIVKEIKYFLTQTVFTKLSLNGLDPGSDIWKKLIPDPDPGIKKAPDPLHCLLQMCTTLHYMVGVVGPRGIGGSGVFSSY
jgi:hypothetical protein